MNKAFIVAEMSGNHNHNLKIAIETIKKAKEAGADGIKMQTYLPDTISLDCDSPDFISNSNLWKGTRAYDTYKKAYTPWEWHKELFHVAKEEGLKCFSTAFDPTSVDFLESLNNPIYKIASFEITDIPLIKYIASKHKPIILSTGTAMEEDINLALETIRKEGNNDITLLKCTSEYPAKIKDANLLTIPDMKKRFNVKVGISDHSLGDIVPIVATTLGAEVIEKHFIIKRSIGGADCAFSMEAEDFRQMVHKIRQTEEAMGIVFYPKDPATIKGRTSCRSLYVSADVKAGDEITINNIKSVRPIYGLHPKYYYDVLGKTFNRDAKKGDRLSFDIINMKS
jgi:pseudaminic acid synthase